MILQRPLKTRVFGFRFTAFAFARGRCCARGAEQHAVSAAWLARHFNDPDLVILQTSRDRTAYDAGHITGAALTSSYMAILRFFPPRELILRSTIWGIQLRPCSMADSTSGPWNRILSPKILST